MGACCTDLDMPAVYEETWHKANKEHHCCECGGVICVGHTYQRIAGLWEGKWDHFTTCERCADLRDSLAEVACPELGNLRDAYMEYCDFVGATKYDEETEDYIYPAPHLTGGALRV